MADCGCGFKGSIPGFGTPGATFIPKVTETDEAVELSWENNRGLPNPDPVAIPKGKEGLSAYQVAVANGFEGTESEWLAALQGANGKPGKTAYEYAKEGGYTGTEEEFAAKLAEEYPTPNWNAAEGEAGHILNKPEGVGYSEYTDDGATTIFGEATVVWNADTEYMGFLELLAPIALESRYKVAYNGTEYAVTPFDINGDGSVLTIGNKSSMNDDSTTYPDAGEPFVIIYMDGMCALVDVATHTTLNQGNPADGSATVSIVELAEIVHPIPSKYTPACEIFYVPIDAVPGYISTKRADIIEAYESGKRIVAVYNGDEVQLASKNDTMCTFIEYTNGHLVAICLYNNTGDSSEYFMCSVTAQLIATSE